MTKCIHTGGFPDDTHTGLLQWLTFMWRTLTLMTRAKCRQDQHPSLMLVVGRTLIRDVKSKCINLAGIRVSDSHQKKQPSGYQNEHRSCGMWHFGHLGCLAVCGGLQSYAVTVTNLLRKSGCFVLFPKSAATSRALSFMSMRQIKGLLSKINAQDVYGLELCFLHWINWFGQKQTVTLKVKK